MEQQEGIHHLILEPIRRLQQGGEEEDEDDNENKDDNENENDENDEDDEDNRETEENEAQQHEQHRLVIYNAFDVNRQSVQYLVDFLNGEHQQVTELDLFEFSLSQPSDGGLDVLIDFFTNQASLSKVQLTHCDFGNAEEAAQLFASFEPRGSVTDLTIYDIRNLEGAVYGSCVSDSLQNAVNLQRLELGWLNAEVIRAFQPGLRAIHRNLKELNLSRCTMGDEGLRLIVDALVGNTTMEILDISSNEITSMCLADIKRLVEFTQLKQIIGRDNCDVLPNNDAAQSLIQVLHSNTSLEGLPGIDLNRFPVIKNILAQNSGLKHAIALLALQPGTGLPIGSKSGIWYKAMAQMGSNNWGASAIFHILQTRPALLEKQLKRPQPQELQQPHQQPVGFVAQVRDDSMTSINNNNDNARKRARSSS